MKINIIILLSATLFFLSSCALVQNEKLTQEKALDIAQNSMCAEIGILTQDIFYNNNTKTWWIDIQTNETAYENCNPACVVYEVNKSVEINWRCTGLIEE